MSNDIPQYPQQNPPPGSVPPGGHPPSGPGSYPPQNNTLALVSLICSLGGLIVGLAAPVGAILGHVALKQIRERGEQGEGMAKAGIIIGWILTGLMVCCVGGIIITAIIGANST